MNTAPHPIGYSFNSMAHAMEGKVLQHLHDVPVLQLVTDTRQIVQASQSLFFAIRGEHHNGHHYLNAAYQAGIRNFVIEESIDISSYTEANIVHVTSCVHALQKVAAFHRSHFQLPVIAITGSNGKTIVKEWLNTLLANDYTIVRNPRSYNSQIGVPLSVWGIESFHTLGIFEAGISQPDEMSALEKVIQPTIGILTTIGQAHAENFHDRAALVHEKCKLFHHCETIIYNGNHPEVIHELQHEIFFKCTKISWGNSDDNDFAVVSSFSNNEGTIVVGRWKKSEAVFQFHIPFQDIASVENAITCIATLLHFGYSYSDINALLHQLQPLSMRLERLEGINNSVLINDVYSNDLHSLRIALGHLAQEKSTREKRVIVSDIPQSGLSTEEWCKRLRDILREHRITRLIGVGEGLRSHASLFEAHAQFYTSTEELIQHLDPQTIQNETVLIKGARSFRFERITELLQEKTHETIMEIDLNAMTHNLNFFRSKLLPETQIMVMVKAFGYGAGAAEVASLLQFNKVNYLAVAYTDEGIALRQAGISIPIMVMNAEHGSYDAMVRYRLEPEIFSLKSLREFLNHVSNQNMTHAYPIHLKIDTGMHRLGFTADEIKELLVVLHSQKKLRVKSVFTHLAATDEPALDSFTFHQLKAFTSIAQELEQSLGYSVIKHALNTGGIQRFSEYQFDMVRLGVGLYGVSADVNEQHQLHRVGTLKSVISQIKSIPVGDSIGYSRKFVASTPIKSATIPLGYADGIRRSMGNGKGYVMINGKRAYILGNVCMDMIMVNVTDIECKEGDAVIVFGEDPNLIQLAQWCDTIPYEILTSISQRVKRIYIQE